MSLEIKIGSRQLVLFLATFAVILTVGLAVGFNDPPIGGVPSVVGHSVDELDLGPIYIDAANGRVGIGTTEPSRPLHIERAQNARTEAMVLNPTDGTNALSGVRVGMDSEYLGGRLSYYPPGYTEYPGFANFTDVAAFGNTNGLMLRTSAPSGIIKFVTTENHIERMRITSNGNVGIGTTNPTKALDVVGTIQASTDVCIAGGGNCLSDSGTGGGVPICSGTLQWIYLTDDEVDSYGPFAGTGCFGSACPNYDTCPGNNMILEYFCGDLDEFTCTDETWNTTQYPNQQKRTVTCMTAQALRCINS